MKKKKTYQQNYNYAKSLAVRWRLSKQQIFERLTLHEVNATIAHKLICALEADGLLDEKRTFLMDVFVQEEKRLGYKRIKEKLASKGYSSNLLSTYTYNKDIELDNCKHYFEKGKKKYPDYRYSDSQREKLINYLKRYGFNDKMIYEVIKTGINYENVM